MIRFAAGLLVLAVVLSPLSASRVRGQVESVDELIVVDSMGKKIGRVLSGPNTSRPIVALNMSGYLILFRVLQERLLVASDDPSKVVYFESADCSGPGYVRTDEQSDSDPLPSITLNVAIGPPGRTVYVPDPEAIPFRLEPQSRWSAETDSCVPSNGEERAATGLALANLADDFTPPFQIVPAPPSCCGDCNGDRSVTVDELVIGVGNALDGCPPSK